MNDDSGDLRDRFRRSDYQSTPTRPRPQAPVVVNDMGPPAQPVAANPVVAAPLTVNNELVAKAKTGNDNNGPSILEQLRMNKAASEFTVQQTAEQIVAPLQETQYIQEAVTEYRAPVQAAEVEYITEDHQIDTAEHNQPDTPATSLAQGTASSYAQDSKSSVSIAAKMVMILVLVASLSGTGYFGSKKYLDISIKRKAGVLAAVSLIPSAYNSQAVGFDVYFPTNMPDGYRVAPGSYSLTKGSLTFNINTADGFVVPVSEQLMPEGAASADQLVPAPTGVKVTNVEDINFPGGKSAYSKWDGKILTSTVVGKTWIIINVTSLTKEEAINLTQTFKPI